MTLQQFGPGRIDPGIPTRYVETFLGEQGFWVEEILSYSGLCTVAKVRNMMRQDAPTTVAIKSFFGYFTVLTHTPPAERSRLYGYSFFKELNDATYQYWLEKFRLEAKTLMSLENPYLVRVYWAKLEEQLPYYVMEYLPEGNLTAYVDRVIRQKGRLSISDVLRLSRAVCCALAVLHQHGVVHRDLTPQNILMRNGVPVLCDLGYARYLNRPSNSETNKAPFFYWPPEYDHSFHHADQTADVYSLGVLMYWLCTGTLPRYGSPPPSALNREVPREMDEVVLRAIQYKATQRYQSVEECLSNIDALAAQFA